MERDPTLQQLASILTAALYSEEEQAESPTPSHLQIDTGTGWIPAEVEVWRAWAGPRAIWGVPYHGPVYALGAPADSPPWNGPRVCRCDTCQTHVSPDRRPN